MEGMRLLFIAPIALAAAAAAQPDAKPQRPSDIPLTAETVVEVALSRSPALKAARARARADSAEARAEGRPEDPRFTGAFKSGDGEGRTEIGLSFDLWTLIGMNSRRRGADAETQRAEAALAESTLTLAAEAKSALYAVEAASATFVLRREHAAAARSSASLADATQAELDADRAEVDLEAARSRLSRVMRAPTNSGWWTKAELPPPPDSDPTADALSTLARQRRQSLAAALAASRAALERAQSWTSSSAGAMRAGVALEKEPNGKRLVGPSFEMDLPLFGALKPRLDAAYARAEEAAADADQNDAELIEELEILRARLVWARKAEKSDRTIIIPARVGTAAETAARLNWIEILREYWTTRTALERAVGGSLPEQGAKQ
jgi:cobalt-zinc-cadmium efflux system outer membrane protein